MSRDLLFHASYAQVRIYKPPLSTEHAVLGAKASERREIFKKHQVIATYFGLVVPCASTEQEVPPIPSKFEFAILQVI